MNIIIVGAGKVGTTLAESLGREGHEITLIDSDAEVLKQALSTLDVQGIVGNGISYSTQMEAGILDADLLIAVTGSDETSLLSCLMAKKAGNCQTIARVRNPEYYNEIAYIKEELGLSMAVNPERAAAGDIMRLIQIPSAMEVETFAKGRIHMVKIKITTDSVMNGIRLSELSAQVNHNFLVCIVERNGEIFIPDGNMVLQAGDTISVCVSLVETADLIQKLTKHTHRIKKVMIAGGSGISYYLTQMLIKAKVSVKIIEIDKSKCEMLSTQLPEAVIVCGDATDQTLLLEEGLQSADAFVSLTNIDEENILLSIFATNVSSAKRITKISRLALEKIINELPVGSVIYPKNITAERIIRYVRAMQNSLGSNVETLYRLENGRVEALEFAVKKGPKSDRFIGVPIMEMNLKDNLLVCGINRNGTIITPSGRDIFEEGDTVVVVTTNTGLNDLKDILRD